VIYQTFESAGSGGGLFTVACTRFPLGGGIYHYEYVVHNLNSDDSAGAFTVSFPSGTTITNAGFHSPEYHSGEPFNNNPWNSATASNGVTWTVDQSFASNPNSNALRWGTAHSFWFDADNIQPSGSSLDYYKVGGSAVFPAPSFPPEAWQTNQTNAHMDINGLSNSPFSGPIVANLNSGAIGSLNFGASQAGLAYDIALTLSPAIPNFLVTPGGQRINVDLNHPTFAFLFNGFLTATPSSSWALPFVAPNGIVDLTGQMAILDPASAENILLTAANELHVTPCPATVLPLTLGDDDTYAIGLGVGSFGCVPSITFAGTNYTTAYVNSNGSVSFGAGVTDYTASVSEFNSGVPRLAGLWSDLNPSAGGTISVSASLSGILAVAFVGVPEYGGPPIPSSFVMEFDTAVGSCAVSGYMPNAGHGTNSIVGLTPGGGVSGLSRTFSNYVGLGSQVGNPASSVYQYVNGGAPSGFSRVGFPTSNGATFIVN
jgi:hypothetical protein